jgi:mannose-6-phosphate isomerase-like protein (cupin superfamily)
VAQARVFRSEEVLWYTPPGHHRAYSKLLVGPDTGSRYIDFRLSLYPPEGYAEGHVHQRAENIYYIIRGHGVVDLDGRRHLVGPNSVVYIPPGVQHAIYNSGTEDLLFVVMASPPEDMPR